MTDDRKNAALNPRNLRIIQGRGGRRRVLVYLHAAPLRSSATEKARSKDVAATVFPANDALSEKEEIEIAHKTLFERYLKIARRESAERFEDWSENASAFMQKITGNAAYEGIYDQFVRLFTHIDGRASQARHSPRAFIKAPVSL